MSAHASRRLAIVEALGVLEVELQRELRGVERGEELAAVDAGDAVLERADEAQAVGGLVGLDVHDGGAVVGEDLGGDRADADPGEVGEFDAFEREAAVAAGSAVAACAGGGRARSSAPSTSAVCSPRSGAGRVNAIGVRDRRDERARGAQLAAVGERAPRRQKSRTREVLEREHVGDRVHGRERDAARDAALEQVGLASARA